MSQTYLPSSLHSGYHQAQIIDNEDRELKNQYNQLRQKVEGRIRQLETSRDHGEIMTQASIRIDDTNGQSALTQSNQLTVKSQGGSYPNQNRLSPSPYRYCEHPSTTNVVRLQSNPYSLSYVPTNYHNDNRSITVLKPIQQSAYPSNDSSAKPVQSDPGFSEALRQSIRVQKQMSENLKVLSEKLQELSAQKAQSIPIPARMQPHHNGYPQPQHNNGCLPNLRDARTQSRASEVHSHRLFSHGHVPPPMHEQIDSYYPYPYMLGSQGYCQQHPHHCLECQQYRFRMLRSSSRGAQPVCQQYEHDRMGESNQTMRRYDSDGRMYGSLHPRYSRDSSLSNKGGQYGGQRVLTSRSHQGDPLIGDENVPREEIESMQLRATEKLQPKNRFERVKSHRQTAGRAKTVSYGSQSPRDSMQLRSSHKRLKGIGEQGKRTALPKPATQQQGMKRSEYYQSQTSHDHFQGQPRRKQTSKSRKSSKSRGLQCPIHAHEPDTDMYQNRLLKKKRDLFKDSKHRNLKHERDHLMKAYERQERSRQEILGKIAKNFYAAYGIK